MEASVDTISNFEGDSTTATQNYLTQTKHKVFYNAQQVVIHASELLTISTAFMGRLNNVDETNDGNDIKKELGDYEQSTRT